MTIFRGFRRLFVAIEELGRALERLARIQEDAGPALDRVDALEISRHKFEAEIEGMLLRAEGKLKAASNAEARERQLKRSYEKHLLDPLDPDSQEGTEETALLPIHAAPGEAQGMSPLRLDLGPNNKAHAVRAKWGR